MAKSKEIRYEMIETTEYVEDSGMVTTYGICCREGNGLGASGGTEYPVVPNISTESDFVEDLIEILMQNRADPIHLKDLIDDYLP